MLELGRYATLKWYDIATPDAPIPAEIGDLARECLVDEIMGGAIELEGLGFVILHRCGEGFYFLLACTWAGNNELWETVWAKDGDADPTFRPWPLARGHHPTFCVWELGAVWHEQQAWSRFLRSEPRRTKTSACTSLTPTPGRCERRCAGSVAALAPGFSLTPEPRASSPAAAPCASYAPCP